MHPTDATRAHAPANNFARRIPPRRQLTRNVQNSAPRLSYLFQEADRADKLRQNVARLRKELRRVAETLGQIPSRVTDKAVFVRRRRVSRKKGDGGVKKEYRKRRR